MIKDVPLTGIFVDDQEAALDFYTGKLGLEKVQDEPYGEGGALDHRLPRGDEDKDRPEEGRERAREGNGRQLGRRGEPYRYPWGVGALLLDQDGSPILLLQESRER
jgi:catechol 2,3-dioxygenase-like lactoylglutathione lyase family enzyme